jgi:hypothetical protein
MGKIAEKTENRASGARGSIGTAASDAAATMKSKPASVNGIRRQKMPLTK